MSYPSQISSSPSQKRKYTYIRRVKLARTTSILNHSVSDIRALQCHSNCLDSINSNTILKLRSQYLSKKHTERNKWLSNWLECNKISIGNDTYMYRWHVDGTEVCINCWLSVTGATKYKLMNCTRTIHGNNNITRINHRLESTLTWLKSYFYIVCDQMPTRNEYHLPCFLQWKDVLDELNTYLISKEFKGYSQPQFAYLMKRNFPNVKLPKYTRLGKCDVCLDFKNKKLKATTEEQRLQVQKEILIHNTNQMNERLEYKQRCLKAGIFLFFKSEQIHSLLRTNAR